MAGIGFELKKMFKKRGILATIRAYGYAGIVCTGPMILGIVMLIGLRVIASFGNAGMHELELLNCMVTYTLLGSLTLSNVFSLVTTRYTADQLYMEEAAKVMPSMWGSCAIMLTIGCTAYGIFLHFAGIPLLYQALCLFFFAELIIVWSQINYLTAIKDYRGILRAFAVSLIGSWVLSFVLIYFHVAIIPALFVSICIAYAVLLLWYAWLLLSYFPKGTQSSLSFLRWMDRYPELSLLGLSLGLGLFGHLVIMWTGNLSVQVQGLFYGAPAYDIPAILAFLSTLVTTVNFVTSVEVNFYPRYRTYFSLFNDGGAYADIKQAEREMRVSLQQELTYTYTKQFFTTVVFIIAGSLLLPLLPLGMTEDMLGVFRVLCIGYAFYAAGNCAMLIQLYFADNRHACLSAVSFAVVSCIVTWLLRDHDMRSAGIAFVAGSVTFTVVSLIGLSLYVRKLMNHVLCNQPLVVREKEALLTKISEYAEQRYRKKNKTEL